MPLSIRACSAGSATERLDIPKICFALMIIKALRVVNHACPKPQSQVITHVEQLS
jgi:hypothetical protein